MCIFIDHDVQLVIDLSAKQVRTRLLLMTMIETILLITSNLYGSVYLPRYGVCKKIKTLI